MSDPAIIPPPASALDGAVSDGFAQVADCGLRGMITLRGDLSSRALRSAATKAGGVRMPAPRMANTDGENGLCWMSPDELLVLCPYGEVAARLQTLRERLAGQFATAADVSDARAMLRVTGPAAREVLAKLCPVDLSPDAFTQGMFRRTRMAQVPAAFWLGGEDDFRIIVFRSVAQYAFDLLETAAAQGAQVGFFTPLADR